MFPSPNGVLVILIISCVQNDLAGLWFPSPNGVLVILIWPRKIPMMLENGFPSPNGVLVILIIVYKDINGMSLLRFRPLTGFLLS